MAVGPVGEGGAFIAVGNGGVFGHNHADFRGAFRRHLPDDHRVGAETGAAVVEHGAVAAHQLAFLVFLQLGEKLRDGDFQAGGHIVKGAGGQGQVLLGGADDLLVPFGDFLRLVPVAGGDAG